jgi:amino acid transporter
VATGSHNDPDHRIGVDFVDILFALVIAEALDALARAGGMSAAGRTHLLFAVVLTITSWVGYHRSMRRDPGEISFDVRNPSSLIPLGRFTIDIMLVVLYWLAVRTTEGGFPGSSDQPSWRPEAIIALSALALYVAWDWLAWRGYSRRGYFTWRRESSWWALILTLLVSGLAAAISPRHSLTVTLFDSLLILIALGYRVHKDWAPRE